MVILPIVGGLVAASLPAGARNAAASLASLVALTCTACAALLYPAISRGAVIKHEVEWLPSLGLNLVLRLDGLMLGQIVGS